MPKSNDTQAKTILLHCVNVVAIVMNWCAASLLVASALLVAAAAFQESGGIGARLIAAIFRGDMIALASQH